MNLLTDKVWRLVAQREISTKIRDKGFLYGTAFMLVLVIGILVAMSLLGGRQTTYDVAVVDDRSAAVVTRADDTIRGQDDNTRIDPVEVGSQDEAEQGVLDGDHDAALVATGDGFEVIGETGVETDLAGALRAAVSAEQLTQNAERDNVDLDQLMAGTQLTERSLDPDADQAGARTGIAFAFALIFYVTALSFGMTISQSVVQEKESRVVEILAAAIPVRAMLWGKILGNTVLGLAQIVLIVAVGLVGLAVTGETELLRGVGPAAVWYVAFFVLGFIALASLWSVAGSLATRQEDLQSTTLPGQVILFVPYLLSVFAGEKLETIISMMPIVSTMIMPGRMAQGDVPFWQIAVAIGATALAAVVFVRIGTRMYEHSLLKTDRKMSYREAFSGSVEAAKSPSS